MCVCVEVVNSDVPISRSRRSGRLRLPPLAYWANQRVIVPHQPGVKTQLIQGGDDMISDATHVSFTDAAAAVSIF